jgi:hypothetical protein
MVGSRYGYRPTDFVNAIAAAVLALLVILAVWRMVS